MNFLYMLGIIMRKLVFGCDALCSTLLFGAIFFPSIFYPLVIVGLV